MAGSGTVPGIPSTSNAGEQLKRTHVVHDNNMLPGNRLHDSGKRLLDLLLAAAGLTVTMPLFLVVAIVILCTSGRPVLFSQDRVGLQGRPFRVFKFRTMVRNADRMGGSVSTVTDARITRVGRILRRTKIDEIPQLLNVLKGDMSFVGPRPDVPEIIAGYTESMLRILTVRPGITSIASLELTDEESILALARDPEDAYRRVVVPYKVALAMKHVDKKSLAFDLEVLLRTVWRVTFGRMYRPPETPGIVQIKESIENLNKSYVK